MNRLFIPFAAIISMSVNATNIFDNETCAIVKDKTKQEAVAIITSAIKTTYNDIYYPELDDEHLKTVNEYFNKTLIDNVYNTCLIDGHKEEMLFVVIDTYIQQKQRKLDVAKYKLKETFGDE